MKTHKNSNIIQVEDSAGDIRLTRKEPGGYQISDALAAVTGGGTNLNHIFKKEKPAGTQTHDLILPDPNIPGKYGRRVLNIIKSTYELKSIPVIARSISKHDNDIQHWNSKYPNC